MPRKRGGAREGTPGKGYSNRTDLGQNYDQSMNTAASGGMAATAPPPPPMQTPDDTPNLDAPTQYPGEPITAGLPIGAGAGPQRDTRQQETQQLKRFLPLIELYVDRPDTPDSVRSLFRYIRGA
jgi:hypothetical protein